MAGTLAKAQRKADVLARLSAALGVQPAELQANAKGDPDLATIMTLERIADALDTNQQAVQRGDLRSTIAAASDDELIALPGIGEKSVAELRAWAKEQPAEAQDEAPAAVEVEEPEETPAVPRRSSGRNRNA